jgi:hypothetical protein
MRNVPPGIQTIRRPQSAAWMPRVDDGAHVIPRIASRFMRATVGRTACGGGIGPSSNIRTACGAARIGRRPGRAYAWPPRCSPECGHAGHRRGGPRPTSRSATPGAERRGGARSSASALGGPMPSPHFARRRELLLAFADGLGARDEHGTSRPPPATSGGPPGSSACRLGIDLERLVDRFAHAPCAGDADLDLARAGATDCCRRSHGSRRRRSARTQAACPGHRALVGWNSA